MNFDDFQKLMEETPIGAAPEEFSPGEGMHTFPVDEAQWHGAIAHRGILHRDEFVDMSLLEQMVQGRLGIPLDLVLEAYTHRPGGPTGKVRILRNRLDQIFLQLHEEGGNMALLGALVGFKLREDGTCQTMTRAIQRAKEANEQ